MTMQPVPRHGNAPWLGTALATFNRRLIVGTLLPVSIWLSIARLTPAILESRSREWPWRVRSRLRLVAMTVNSAAEGSSGERARGVARVGPAFPPFAIAMSADQLTCAAAC